MEPEWWKKRATVWSTGFLVNSDATDSPPEHLSALICCNRFRSCILLQDRITTRQISDLYVPTANLKIYQKVVYYQGIKIYNHLPKTIKDLSGDKNKFKLALQRYLLHNSFYSLKEYFNTELVLISLSISLLPRLILIIVLIITSKTKLWHYTKAQFILFILTVHLLVTMLYLYVTISTSV